MFFVHTGKRVVSYNSGRLPGAARVVYTTRANRIPSICNVADQPVDQTKRLDYLKISLRPPLPNKMKTGKRGIVTLDQAENIKRSQLERATRFDIHLLKGIRPTGSKHCPIVQGSKVIITIARKFPFRQRPAWP